MSHQQRKEPWVMGELIRRTAAADNIIADVRETMMNATAKGGAWQTLAQERLASVLAVVDRVEAQMADTTQALKPILATLNAKDVETDRVLGRVSDDIWNEVGRPANDPALSVLFPGGIAYYAGGRVVDQPDRMELLAELLESNIHPLLSTDQVKAHASDVRAAAQQLRAAVDAARTPSGRLDLLDRVRRSVALVAQTELAALKRTYKAEHFTEADIHSVIPDRPAVLKRATATPTPAPSGPSEPAPKPPVTPAGS
jgi:hypothetical protein